MSCCGEQSIVMWIKVSSKSRVQSSANISKCHKLWMCCCNPLNKNHGFIQRASIWLGNLLAEHRWIEKWSESRWVGHVRFLICWSFTDLQNKTTTPSFHRANVLLERLSDITPINVFRCVIKSFHIFLTGQYANWMALNVSSSSEEPREKINRNLHKWLPNISDCAPCDDVFTTIRNLDISLLFHNSISFSSNAIFMAINRHPTALFAHLSLTFVWENNHLRWASRYGETDKPLYVKQQIRSSRCTMSWRKW